jgi:hypothetical protein
MKLLGLLASAVIALAPPAFSQTMSWETTGPHADDDFGNGLVFANGGQGFTATSWSHTGGRRNQSFGAALGVIYSTGIGVTHQGEGSRVPEHQIDNGRGNDWVLLIFEGPVSEVTLTIDPYGIWDRDVTYYTANLSEPVDLAGLTYTDLAALGFGERVDDLSTRSSEEREIEITSESGGFNAILIGAQQGKPKPGSVDRFKITGLNATFTVPEPSAALLGLMGGLMLLQRRRR